MCSLRSTGVATGSLRSDQDRLLAEQEEGLDLLRDIIRRQRGMGEDIFREVTQQNDLIDEIDDRVENVNQRLLTTSNNIAVVTRTRQNLWLLDRQLRCSIPVMTHHSAHMTEMQFMLRSPVTSQSYDFIKQCSAGFPRGPRSC